MEPLPQESAAEGRSVANVDVLDLLSLRDRMKQQLMEWNTAVRANQENDPDCITDENVFKSATQDLEKDMEEVKGSFQNKTLALQRIQIMAALRNKVTQNDNDSRLIMDTMKQIVMLSNAIIEGEQQVHEKKQKLLYIKKKRFSLQKAGQQILQEIRTMMEKQREKQESKEVSEMLKKVHEKIRRERDITAIIQNIFQHIIIGSRLNWAEDPSLKETLLHLEKYVSFL